MGPPPPSLASAPVPVSVNVVDGQTTRGAANRERSSFFSATSSANHFNRQEMEMMNRNSNSTIGDEPQPQTYEKPPQNVWGSPFTLPSLKSSIMSGSSAGSLSSSGSSTGLISDSKSRPPQLRLSSSSSMVNQPPHFQGPIQQPSSSSSSQPIPAQPAHHRVLNAPTGMHYNSSSNNLSQNPLSSIISRPKSDLPQPSLNSHMNNGNNILAGMASNSNAQHNSLLLNSDYYFEDLSAVKSSAGSTVDSLTPFVRSSSSSSSNITHYAGNNDFIDQRHKQLLMNSSATSLDNNQSSFSSHDDLNIGQLSLTDSLQPEQIEEFIRLIQNRIRSREMLAQRIHADISGDKLLVSKLNALLAQSMAAQTEMPPAHHPVLRSNTIPTSAPAPHLIVRAQTMPEPIASFTEEPAVQPFNHAQSTSGQTVISEKKEIKHEELICRKWNKGECFKGSHCSYYHECLNCGGVHQRPKCPLLPSNSEKNEVCIKWNNKECQWNEMCHRRHICCNCKGHHPAADCLQPPSNKPPGDIPTPNNDDSKSVASTVETTEKHDEEAVCINWNEGRCRMGERCKRQHKCTICQSLNHQALHCDYAGPATAQNVDKIDEVCLNWNSGRCNLSRVLCKRRHACSYCGSEEHIAVGCPSVPSPAELANVGVDYCWNWNAGACDDSVYPNENAKVDVGGNCKRIHACSNCQQSGHTSINCHKESVGGSSEITSKTFNNNTKLSEICMNWNMNKCRLGDRCKRLHVCSLCNSSTHKAPDCSSKSTHDHLRKSASSAEVCMNWNHGKCKAGKRCRRQHICNQCRSEGHTQIQCPTAKPSQFASSKAI